MNGLIALLVLVLSAVVMIAVPSFTPPAAVAQYTDLMSQKLRVETQDLRIAFIVMSIGGTLVTRNRRDFDRIPGLKIEDWSF